jgi:hypothetical protein
MRRPLDPRTRVTGVGYGACTVDAAFGCFPNFAAKCLLLTLAPPPLLCTLSPVSAIVVMCQDARWSTSAIGRIDAQEFVPLLSARLLAGDEAYGAWLEGFCRPFPQAVACMAPLRYRVFRPCDVNTIQSLHPPSSLRQLCVGTLQSPYIHPPSSLCQLCGPRRRHGHIRAPGPSALGRGGAGHAAVAGSTDHRPHPVPTGDVHWGGSHPGHAGGGAVGATHPDPGDRGCRDAPAPQAYPRRQQGRRGAVWLYLHVLALRLCGCCVCVCWSMVCSCLFCPLLCLCALQVFASLVQPVVVAVPLPMPHRATRARRAAAIVQGDNDVLVTIPKCSGGELLAVSARGLVRCVHVSPSVATAAAGVCAWVRVRLLPASVLILPPTVDTVMVSTPYPVQGWQAAAAGRGCCSQGCGCQTGPRGALPGRRPHWQLRVFQGYICGQGVLC